MAFEDNGSIVDPPKLTHKANFSIWKNRMITFLNSIDIKLVEVFLSSVPKEWEKVADNMRKSKKKSKVVSLDALYGSLRAYETYKAAELWEQKKGVVGTK